MNAMHVHKNGYLYHMLPGAASQHSVQLELPLLIPKQSMQHHAADAMHREGADVQRWPQHQPLSPT
jgi:hypothetical protein